MELRTTIVTLVILIICIAPFIWMSKVNKNKGKRLLQLLSGLAGKNNTSIAQHDIWHHTAIGTDEATRMIFFAKKGKDADMLQQIDIGDIQRCRVINTSRTVRHNNGNVNVIDKLELGFQYHDKNKPETVLEFYDAYADHATLSVELHLAEKWCKLVNEKIGTMAKKSISVS